MKLSSKTFRISNLVRYSLMPMLAAFGTVAHAQMPQNQPSMDQPKSTIGSTTRAESHTHRDAAFLRRAAEENLGDVEFGKLGAEKAQNQQLKQFALKLQEDHQKANEQLQPLAQKLGVQFPQKLDARKQQELSRLQKLSGAEFDKEYTTYLLRDHARTVDLYQREANRTQNADLKQYAQNTLPTLQTHLQTSETIAKDVGVDQKTIAGIMKRHHEAAGTAPTPTGREKGSQKKSSGSGGY